MVGARAEPGVSRGSVVSVLAAGIVGGVVVSGMVASPPQAPSKKMAGRRARKTTAANGNSFTETMKSVEFICFEPLAKLK